MRLKTILLATALGMTPGLALAQTPAGDTATLPEATSPADPAQEQEVVIVGSQIRGSRITDALPVTVLDQRQIDATGALSGDDLIRAIPQMGDVAFNPSNNPQTSNAARGDVNSINLRNLGTGNTLLLLNGRRLVSHPTSQAGDGNIPVLGPNSNSIPVAGIDRLEILRDGAAAIYGADAVAGVVNTITRSDFDGARLDLRYGWAEGTNREETQVTALLGRNFAGRRGNLTLYLDYTDRNAQLAEDRAYTATKDLRSFFADDPFFAGNLTADDRATQSPWANLTVVGGPGTIRRGTTALTSGAGAFHTQSVLNPGCHTTINADACYGSGTRATGTTLRNERFDTAIGTTVTPAIERFNSFLTGHFDFSDSLTAYTELGFYRAESHAVQPPVINLNAIVIPRTNYWNPFGPVTFANGQANPNRIPGLTNVPTAGLPVRLSTYRFVDAGFQTVDVTNWQGRGLVGLRGQLGRFDFDTAILYSEARAHDVSPNVDMTALQQSLALSTPDAYNPFSGGCSATPAFGDCSPSSQAAIDAILFDLDRRSRTTLLLGDFKVSRSDLFSLWAGDLGIAVGVEARRETQEDIRDPNVNGTNTFVDAVTGEVSLSNTAAVSPTPSTSGSREVVSAFAEFAVPLVSPDMDVPLVHRLNLQVAGRVEHYSDFGTVAKPKAAVAWDLVDGFRLRGSYSEGFRAPNLEQTNTVAYSRLGSSTDFYRCEADLRAGRLPTGFGNCTRGISFPIAISGNPDLDPEHSRNWTVGAVVEPDLPPGWGRLTLTADYWSIRQEGIVGQFGTQNNLVLDYLLRLQGSSNPNVIRAAPTVDDTPVFAGTGLAPAGAVTQVLDQFVNLQPQTVEGFDFGLFYRVNNTGIGDFDFTFNAALLTKFSRDIPPQVQVLFDAREAGQINPLTPLVDSSDLVGVRGRPEWRLTSSLTWSSGPFQVGAFANYIDSVIDPTFTSAIDLRPYRLESQTTVNLYVQYTLEQSPIGEARLRLGVRNLFDTPPPLTAEGYLGSLYNAYGRYWYGTLGFRF